MPHRARCLVEPALLNNNWPKSYSSPIAREQAEAFIGFTGTYDCYRLVRLLDIVPYITLAFTVIDSSIRDPLPWDSGWLH